MKRKIGNSWGVGGLYMTPLEQKFRGGGRGLIGRTIRGRGMDIFWNHTLAAMLEGILLPSNMAAKTTLCLYLVKRLIVTLSCPVNVTTPSFQHFP